ncbi:MAG: hypothetical protein Q9184_004838 [Pyrenodesmia sp. 2 TL-2023]
MTLKAWAENYDKGFGFAEAENKTHAPAIVNAKLFSDIQATPNPTTDRWQQYNKLKLPFEVPFTSKQT